MFDKLKALKLLMKHLKLFAIGDQRGDVEVHVREVEPAPLGKNSPSCQVGIREEEGNRGAKDN